MALSLSFSLGDRESEKGKLEAKKRAEHLQRPASVLTACQGNQCLYINLNYHSQFSFCNQLNHSITISFLNWRCTEHSMLTALGNLEKERIKFTHTRQFRIRKDTERDLTQLSFHLGINIKILLSSIVWFLFFLNKNLCIFGVYLLCQFFLAINAYFPLYVRGSFKILSLTF